MSPNRKQTNPKRQFYLRTLFETFLKLDPRQQIRCPVMFAIEVISLLLTGLWLWALVGGANVRLEVVAGVVALWLGLTALFTNFADALTEGRRKTQTESLRRGCQDQNQMAQTAPPHD